MQVPLGDLHLLVPYVHSSYAWPTLSFLMVSEAASPRPVNHFPLGAQGGALTVSGLAALAQAALGQKQSPAVR